MGEIAVEKPAENNILSGVLLKKNFSYHIFAAEDIPSNIMSKTYVNIFTFSVHSIFNNTIIFMRY